MPFYDQLLAATSTERQAFLAIPILQLALRGEITREQYRMFLGQAYHHVRHTVPLLMAYGWLLKAVGEYIEEEMGHEAWILDDIAACEGDPEEARNADPLPATELMVAYAYDMIQRRHPVGFFGMVLVLEGTSVAIASQAAAVIQERLDLPKQAFRYLNSHGSLDQDHIKFFENLINRIDEPEDQRLVIHSAKMFYRLYGNIFRAIAEQTQC